MLLGGEKELGSSRREKEKGYDNYAVYSFFDHGVLVLGKFS